MPEKFRAQPFGSRRTLRTKSSTCAPVNPDLDGNDRPSYRQVTPLPVKGGMAFLQHGRHVPDEPLDLPESQGLAR